MPSPPAPAIGLVGDVPGAASAQKSDLGLTMMPNAAASLAPTVSAGTNQLLVLFHPNHLDQFVRVKQAIETAVDKPARQVVIEGLVLEVSKQAIEELGVQWTQKGGANMLQLGTLTQLIPGSGQASLNITRNTLSADPNQFMARINALVDSNKAEVLSRPSVLTLDNRQATIRVGNDIPIATSKDTGAAAGGRVSFSFQYLPTGIQLNVRPRIAADGREISMIIDATVSATVPGQDLRVVDPTNGFLLASAPTISQRRVQTYARIANNAPLIIGGLVSRDQIKQEDKVPGLGDIPFLGRLFGYESNKNASSEVIIVLTPSVVTEEFRATKPQAPKDDDRFDQFGTSLFRESYRIRAEDLIDSQYIRFNQRLLNYRGIVRQLIERNPDLAKAQPFARFVGTSVPGEFIFVSGMLSRMLERLKMDEVQDIDKVMYFEAFSGASFKRESVGGLLKRLGDGKTHQGFFEKNKGKALTLRFRFARNLTTPEGWATEPLAEVNLVDCPDRETWKKLLWEQNQPVDGVQQHYTMVIHEPSDLRRLKLAFSLKNAILANGNEAGTIFDNFLPGRMVAIQENPPHWERTLEATIARYFYFGEFFYPAFSQELERAIQALDRSLRQPAIAQYLTGIALPAK
jgi:general secretion pathway protein D